MNASEFYHACRNGELAKVQSLLESMSKDEIDRMEPNGSTALHAAAYYGHGDIVRVLLEKGAARKQNNKYGKTPEQEAKTPDIVQIFHSMTNELDSYWIISDAFGAISYNRRFYSFNHGPPSLSSVAQKLLNVQELRDGGEATSYIRDMFKRSLENNDITMLVRAYTMESSFYKILAETLKSHNALTDEERENPPWFCAYARLLASDDPKLRPYQWIGETYRGMSVSKYSLTRIQIGKMIMNKALLSTTQIRQMAEAFGKRMSGKNESQLLICKLIINDPRAALDITKLSQCPAEQEILILPCKTFEITGIERHANFIEVTLVLD